MSRGVAYNRDRHQRAVLLTVGRSYVGNDVTRSTLLDRACACSYENLPKYRSYRVSNTDPWARIIVCAILLIFATFRIFFLSFFLNDFCKSADRLTWGSANQRLLEYEPGLLVTRPNKFLTYKHFFHFIEYPVEKGKKYAKLSSQRYIISSARLNT